MEPLEVVSVVPSSLNNAFLRMGPIAFVHHETALASPNNGGDIAKSTVTARLQFKSANRVFVVVLLKRITGEV